MKRAAQIIAGLNIIMVLAALVLSIVISGRLVYEVQPLNAIVYSVLAVLILSRQPRHTVGWLFLVVGFFSALATVGFFLEGSEKINSSQLVQGLTDWVGHLIWIPIFFIPMTLILQFFPDGRLPSRRWWPITAATLIGIVGYAASLAFYPWPFESQDILDTYNPLGIPGSEAFFESFVNISLIFFAIGTIGSLVSVVVRFYRSQGIERLQMKWLVYAAVVGISSMLLTSLFLGSGNPISDFIFLSLPTLFGIIIGLAILRYHLFDIDIIIRRTLQYAILTGVLALIYFGLVVTLQAVFSAIGNQQSPIFIVISTLVIAGLFNPLRLRIQNSIDRRFYRKKYHAEQALAQFAATTRDEVDLDKLTAALLEVVQETVQPESVGFVLISNEE